MTGFVDIHCHVIAGIDDGPREIEDSFEMLRIARADGITSTVATPHINNGLYDTEVDEIKRGLALLKETDDRPELHMGADVRISSDLPGRIRRGEVPLINGRNFLLLELPTFGIPPMDHLRRLFATLGEMEVYPVISHPERNMIILENISVLQEMVNHGVYCQVTAMSITGGFGREIEGFTRVLFRKGLVHAVATDAHDPKERPPVLSRAYEKVSRLFGQDTAERVFLLNPRKILQGQGLEA